MAMVVRVRVVQHHRTVHSEEQHEQRYPASPRSAGNGRTAAARAAHGSSPPAPRRAVPAYCTRR
jgi:hypothetical protein